MHCSDLAPPEKEMARGRKKKKTIWLPHVVEVEDTRLWHPRVPQQWMELFEWMTIPLDPESPANQKIIWRYARLVLAEVIRQRWDKNLTIRVDRQTQREIEAHGALASELISVILAVGCKRPLELFCEVFWEFEWNGFASSGKTKTEVVRELQHQNAVLRDYRCPFVRPRTRLLFSVLAECAETPGGTKKNFYRDVYRPFLQAREKFAQFVLQKGQHLHELDAIASEIKIVRQGQKISLPKGGKKKLESK